ncbi:MAG: hypothetical protein QG606_413 [Patescibacteria group bacterium]|nr:hypothetical protein [Patescibacteria group bacterium]
MKSMKFFSSTKGNDLVSVGSSASDTVKRRRLTKTGFLGGLGVILVVGSLGLAMYFYLAYQEVLEAQTPSAELASLLVSISEHLELPLGETPTLATVTDREKLSGQDFFASSQNGDKVLLYQEAKKAILYRPSTGKIVNVAAINASDSIDTEPAQVEEAQTVPKESVPAPISEPVVNEPAKVVFLNGSTKTGVTQPAEEKILAAFPEGVVVAGKEKASKNTYQGIIVADISGKASARASEIATTLGGTMSAFPAEELVPGEADIVVVIGNTPTSMSVDTNGQSNTILDTSKNVDTVPQKGATVQQ